MQYIVNISDVELFADKIRLLKKSVCIARVNAFYVEVVVLTIWCGLVLQRWHKRVASIAAN